MRCEYVLEVEGQLQHPLPRLFGVHMHVTALLLFSLCIKFRSKQVTHSSDGPTRLSKYIDDVRACGREDPTNCRVWGRRPQTCRRESNEVSSGALCRSAPSGPSLARSLYPGPLQCNDRHILSVHCSSTMRRMQRSSLFPGKGGRLAGGKTNSGRCCISARAPAPRSVEEAGAEAAQNHGQRHAVPAN